MKIFKRLLTVFLIGMIMIVSASSLYAKEPTNNINLNGYESDGYKYTFTVEGLKNSYAWTGSSIKPTIKVKETKTWSEIPEDENEDSISKTETRYLDEGEESDYIVEYSDNTTDVGIVTVKIIGKGKYTGTITKTFKISENKINVSVSSISKTGAKISFNKINGASQYTVVVKGTNYNKTYHTSSTSLTLTDLKAGTNYTVKVTAKNKNGSKGGVGSTTFKTQYSMKITIDSITTKGGKVSFDSVNGATQYNVVVKDPDSKTVINKTVKTKSLSLTGLKSGKKYTVKVTAIDANGNKIGVGSKTFTTKYSVGKVTISSTKAGNEIAYLKWKAVTNASGYQIYRATSKNGKYTKVATVSNKTKSYTDYMLSNKTYYYKIRAYRKVNNTTVYGSYSDIKKISVKRPTNKTYYLRVNAKTNVTTIYQKNTSGEYKAVDAYATSCGTNNATKAILGTHYTTAKYRWKYMFGNCYTQYATRITGHYLFHSLPYTQTKENTFWYREYNKLGSFASAGCVRLRCIDAKWIYDHCPIGTKVVVVYSKTDPLKKPTYTKISANSKNKAWDPTDPNPNNPWKK